MEAHPRQFEQKSEALEPSSSIVNDQFDKVIRYVEENSLAPAALNIEAFDEHEEVQSDHDGGSRHGVLTTLPLAVLIFYEVSGEFALF